ncbi:hypothetical protein niasHT_021925 [Heterodera trifolii]|uniref:Odorant receptor n=1 Tax=Heterodera trifolii TaxID=157864 RepID=A0ABD2KCQ5_9BILA
MTTSAQRREQLEAHLQKFREIADQRVKEKIVRWSYYLPAMVSATILICQIANTIIFASFAYNFGKLYIMLDDYMRKTDAMNITMPNSTVQFQYKGINVDRITKIDNYHDQLWNLFIAEVIELIFPVINLFMFAWIVKDKRRRFPSRVQIIYLLCPALALILSITQALTIHVTVTESIYTVRFLLVKLLGVLLEVNRAGRFSIEQYFECEFFNDDDIVKPPCAGQIHDSVLSKSTMTVVMTIHIIPIVIFIYLLVRNLKSDKLEHLFLYIESVGSDPSAMPGEYGDAEKGGHGKMTHGAYSSQEQQTLKETLNDLLLGFNAKFMPKRVFCDSMSKQQKVNGSNSSGGDAGRTKGPMEEKQRPETSL